MFEAIAGAHVLVHECAYASAYCHARQAHCRVCVLPTKPFVPPIGIQQIQRPRDDSSNYFNREVQALRSHTMRQR